MNKPIFMDYLSTTPVDPRVIDVVSRCMSDVIGNASSSDHCFGKRAAEVVEAARDQIASLVAAQRAKVIFTSGATEAANIVIRHIARSCGPQKARIVLSPLEHSAVLETCYELAAAGQAQLVFLSVDGQGRLELQSLQEELRRGADLVCSMAANNEVGNIYPTEEIGRVCSSAGVPFLCDASQAAGRIPIKFDDWRLTYMIVSAHKMYGPKGIGAIIADRQHLPAASFAGGNQEFSVRPGTVNVPAVAGFGEAARLRLMEMHEDEAKIRVKRDRLRSLMQERLAGLVVNGDAVSSLAGVLHVSIPGVPNDAVIARLSDYLAISRGAACSSGIEKPSHVLLAMGMNDDLVEGSLRISIGKFTSDDEVVQAAELVCSAIIDVQSLIGRETCQRVC